MWPEMGWSEKSTIQAAIVEWAEEAGWEYIPGSVLPRDEHDVVIESWARDALSSLNPDLDPARNDGDTESVNIALDIVATAILDATNGLVAANEVLTVMLRGDQSFPDIHGRHEPRRFIDFGDLNNNRLVVADEVTVRGGEKPRRFDVVFYVNGFPLVVVETKTPVKQKVSWLNAAKDIYDTYEVEYPQFFATNVFSVATDGLDLRMAPVRAEPDPESEFWAKWGETTGDAKLTGPARVERDAPLLFAPQMVLTILRDFAMYRHAKDASEQDVKFLPRYPQVEAAVAIHDKVLAGGKSGLVWHHQGSGKTELMAFTAARLLRDPNVGDPTVIVIADRKDLVRQTAEMFQTAGLPQVETPSTSRELRRLLRKDQRGIIITTVHKFAEAGHLNDRDNIIVLVDEAHRSQEGKMGDAWRAAVPNARFFGMTGTAIRDKDRSTFKLFGDPGDPDFVMSRYTPEQSIADGFTKPVVVEGRSVGFDLDKEALDEAFDQLAEEEDLDEDDKVALSNKVSHIETVLSNPDRIAAVCADIVDHFLAYVAPLGQKAQVVAYNQKLVVAYAKSIQAELDARQPESNMPVDHGKGGEPRTVGVVMHVADNKDTPAEYRPYILTDEKEEALKRRFKRVDDPLSFVVVTAKWMTGFNAPVEGVLYLDKPLKAANLFQTITRPNRPWKNPLTGQRKEYGRIVDYIGLAKAIGDALLGPSAEGAEPEPSNLDISQLVAKFMGDLTLLIAMFDGIDRSDIDFASLAQAHERIPDDSDNRTLFIERFTGIQRIWEFLDPNPMLQPFKNDYRWLSALYQSIRPKDGNFTLLWERLGAKTEALIHSHMSNMTVKGARSKTVTLDPAGIEKIKAIAALLQKPLPKPGERADGEVYQEILDSIEARLKRRLAEDEDSPVYKSLAERIEKLRNQQITNVAESLQFLEDALQVAKDVVAADRAVEEGDLDPEDPEAARLYDPKVGALTEIVEQNTPPGLHKIIPDIVHRIDVIVAEAAYTGWIESDRGDKEVRKAIRSTLRNYSLPVTGDLFDKTYAYVRENY